MQKIADWLAQLGMSEYTQRFAANRIDFSVLHDLTDQDLKELGVVLGDRRKMLRAIGELNGSSNAPAGNRATAAKPSVAAPTAPRLSAADTAGERRYLTVMFCDLVGSTGIAAKLDAEEWRDLVGSYLDAASAAVTDMGGHVVKKLGDGILAVFGYPLAHENEAERAARAALSIQRALAELNRKNVGTGKAELSARIGLETGPAVVDSGGEIYGDVANVAARVQAQAEAGAVLITARVQRQIAGLFVVEERGTHALKGVPEPTALYRLMRASGGGRRTDQHRLTPLVGRGDEMTMLARRWERARAGEGQLVLIVGEPGLGKSRLMEEFHARLSDTPHTWVEWSCSQLLQNTPLHPIAEWGRVRFGGADVPAEQRLADLESSLAQVRLDAAELVPLLAPLLDLAVPKERLPPLAGEELRRRQLAALTDWTLAGARVQPVVLVLEDLHWADPTTIDVLRGIAEQGALAPLFILATTRPEFRAPWSMRSHHGTISLAPLDRAQVCDMVAELAAHHALPKDVVEDVATRTGGVPLFVEEVTRLLLERGQEDAVPAIPPTLQQSLMARLDRLGPTRDVAHIGSVIGRGFSYGLLRAVAGMDDTALQTALEKLAEADIVLAQGLPPYSDYRFKHALVQDVAYENLLKSRRQILHRRVAETLRDQFADMAVTQPEVLAHHFTQAALTDAAIEWWGKAGDQALHRSAFQEAISHLGKAIEMADKKGDFPAGHRVKLQTDYGQALLWSKGYADKEATVVFARAERLANGIDDTAERRKIYYGQCLGNLLRGEYAAAQSLAEHLLDDAESGGQTQETAFARRVLGLTHHMQGAFAEAQTLLEEALNSAEGNGKFDVGLDMDVAAKAYLSHTVWVRGEFARARRLITESVARAVAASDIPDQCTAYSYECAFAILQNDVEATRVAAEKLSAVAQEHGTKLFSLVGRIYGCWAQFWLDRSSANRNEFQEALADYTAEGNRWLIPFFLGLLAAMQMETQGEKERAASRLDEALVVAQQTGEHWTDAFLHRIRGEILLKLNLANTAPAEEAFLTAVAVARQQHARAFELRAALSLAKLYQSTNRAADAQAVLARALRGFSPTPEFPEIEQAQTLLDAARRSSHIVSESTLRTSNAG
jgi:class 3 adenylate cyclase/tetratricopeptide (TPR) repeat protein